MPKKALLGGGDLPKIIQIISGGSATPLQNLATTSSSMVSQASTAINKTLGDPLSDAISVLNTNPYLIGVLYLFLNLGGRFISMELTKRQEWFLSQPFLRPFILFAVMFISTRNLATAFWTTLGILLVLWVFANENSSLCLIPGWKEKIPDTNYGSNMNNINKTEVPEDGHQDTHKPDTNTNPSSQPIVKNTNESDKPDTNIKPPVQPMEKNTNDLPNTDQSEKAQQLTKDSYINNIKEDPIGHENIKETYADYND